MDKRFLTFHLGVPLDMNLGKEELYEEMNIVMSNAVAICDTHMDLVLKVLDGEETIEYVKDVINPMRDE